MIWNCEAVNTLANLQKNGPLSIVNNVAPLTQKSLSNQAAFFWSTGQIHLKPL